jgi:hypothetical protein
MLSGWLRRSAAVYGWLWRIRGHFSDGVTTLSRDAGSVGESIYGRESGFSYRFGS